jgi:hypothetical protein
MEETFITILLILCVSNATSRLCSLLIDILDLMFM